MCACCTIGVTHAHWYAPIQPCVVWTQFYCVVALQYIVEEEPSCPQLENSTPSFQDNWNETLHARRTDPDDPCLVAAPLRKFQDSRVWPFTKDPLPEELEELVKKRRFSWLQEGGYGRDFWALYGGLAFCFLIFSEGLLFVADTWSVHFSTSFRSEDCQWKGLSLGVLIGSCIALPTLLYIVLSRGVTLRMHVKALHLLFVDDRLTGGDEKGVAYSVSVKKQVHTVYNNGVYDQDMKPSC